MKRYILSLLLCVLLSLGAANSAFGKTHTSAKQLFLADLQNNTILLTGLPYQISSGTSVIEIKKLETNLPESEAFLQLLADAKLKLDSKIDNPARKMAINYTLTLGREDYNGSLFLDSNKLIISTEFMDIFKALDRMPAPGGSTLPRYIYLNSAANSEIWDSMGQSEVSPAFKEMLVFICEAIPEHYFKLSSTGQKVVLHIDRNGLPDIVRALALKVMTEQDRFADLVVNIDTTLDPAVNVAEEKQAVLESLKDLPKVMLSPDSPDKMLELAGDELAFDLIVESSLQPAGPDKYLLNLGINDLGTSSNINIQSNFQGGKENNSGSVLITISIVDKEEDFSFSGKMNQDFHLTTNEYSADSMMDLNISDGSGAGRYLTLSLKGTKRHKPEKSVTINIPELTPANSVDLTEAGSRPSQYHKNVRIVLDGEALSFDAAPVIKDGRTMVPVRNLAERLGFTVVWREPNQIIMNKGDTNISMFLGEPLCTVNGTQKRLDVPPFESSGCTMVPVRFIAEESGCMVYYSEASNTVYINHKARTQTIPRHYEAL